MQLFHERGEDAEGCFSMALCFGYFIVFIIKLFFCFTPIVLGYAKYGKYVHHQMVALDTLTDLPLVFMIIIGKAYEIHIVVFFDIVYKIMLLLSSYSYHLVINIVLKQFVLDTDALDDEEDDDGDETGVAEKEKE